jgi:histidine triad (HIT) family protein
MGIRPIRPGELIIVPKKHIDHFCDIPDDLATHILLQAQRLSRAIRETLNPQRVGLVVHGFGVPHAHLNVVPLHESEDITSAQYAYLDGNRIGFSEDRVPIASRDELDRIAQQLGNRARASRV